MHILLIEPDRPLAEIYQQALLRAGHQVTVCAGAQAAILSADQQTPDLVILELQLVEHSGIEFLYEFRSYTEWQNMPIIVHTMVPSNEFTNSQQLLRQQLGVRAYLYKPRTNLEDLMTKVSELTPVNT